ncbi:2-(1,2-epoxy-1,2-dihydrophenyl)acetyl-CoA isomerase PaaG [Marinomonas sp. PE14-40]|uniref:2-(1,2-epoxy-1,2-dihydrophenyl)acetyl-CoA isomerase PaaG n=1 Tax=Marinomonas sp. PE14-40 TaxID=3060621 RepID=UPI003F67510E
MKENTGQLEPIILEINKGIAVLTLNRPEQLNSFNAHMHEEMRLALKRIENDASVRVLVITGAGRGFCAGQDLSDRNVAPGGDVPDLGESLELKYNPMIRKIKALPLPVICAVNGVAAGAGANIALACDIVLAAKSASFIQAFCKLGLIPDSGGTWSLPKTIGMARAKGLALLGEELPAEKAESWGLIWRAIDNESLMDETMAMALHFSEQPTKGLALIKRALHASEEQSFDAQLDLERDLQRLAGRSDDYREGVNAFIEKRPAKFTGN